MKGHDHSKDAAPAKDAASVNQQGKKDSKTATILRLLRASVSLNRFDAEGYGDHCLNSTIATLRAEGHLITDKWEEVPNRFGSTSRVKRYSYVGGQYG